MGGNTTATSIFALPATLYLGTLPALTTGSMVNVRCDTILKYGSVHTLPDCGDGNPQRKLRCSILNLAYVKSILIVDDSAVIRCSLRRLLGAHPDWIICGEAENGCDGIEKAAKLRPDLIVIDLAMPILNGIDASRVLKGFMPAVPIVMFTSFSDPCIKRTAMDVGLDAFVDKSEFPETLLSCIERLLVPKPLERSDSAA
jgi:CheY-like chemotaxis protein